MKIIIAAEIFPPDIGGPATYSTRLAGELLARGHDVKLICYGEKDDVKYSPSPIRISRQNKLPVRYVKYFWSLLKMSFSADVIYAQGPVSSGWPALWVKKILGKKLVVKVVGDYAWEQARNAKIFSGSLEDFQKLRFSGKTSWLKRIEKKVCQKADAVIVPSCYLKNIVAGWGVVGEKIKVVYNSFTKINLMIGKNQAKEKIKLNGDLILSIGRLVGWKGFPALIEIMPRLLSVNPNFKLIIIGEGPEKETLEKKISSLKLQDKIFLTGKINYPEIILYLKAVDLFVLNSGYEGLSHTILEAMAAGVPIIASKIGGNLELIKHNYNGWLVDYNDKEALFNSILNLWRDKNLQNKFTDNSEKFLEKFEFSKMIEETIKVLTK